MKKSIDEELIWFSEKILEYHFFNLNLLKTALQHTSWVHEYGDTTAEDNERLEFLGDAALNLIIAHILMEKFPNEKEGRLSRMRAIAVGEQSLSLLARSLGLNKIIMLGKGELRSGGENKDSILANTMEAVIGAVYLDGGWDRVFGTVERLFSPIVEQIGHEDHLYDYKSQLQEYTQRISGELPYYKVIQESGPAHKRQFKVGIDFKGSIIAEGEGTTKKIAEQNAAKEAYLWLTLQKDI